MTPADVVPRLLDRAGSHDAVLDVAIAHALLRRASRGEIGPVVRIYRPPVPVVAFGRSDTRRHGIDAAVRACRDAGFEPVIRSPGGRAVAYTADAVAIDHICPESDPGRRLRRRFVDYGELLADVLRGLGVDARVGEVPGEYCPGAYSVNARGVVKLIGTAQRVVRDAWLFSAVVIVDGSAELKPLLRNAYDALGLPFDAASVGSLRDELGSVDVTALERALRTAYVGATDSEPLDPRTLELAYELRGDHVL